MADRPAPGASADSISAELIENRGFTVGRRGFDQDEVKGFLQVVAGAIRALHERIDRLQQDLADAEYRSNNPKLDEDTLMRLVGDETGSILRTARATAAEMSANADRRAQEMRDAVERECAQLRELVERDVDELRARAEHEIDTQRATALAETHEEKERIERESTELRSRAESETTALRRAVQNETADLRSRAQAEAARVVDEARQTAGELREQAESALGRATEEADQAAARIRNNAAEDAEQILRRARTEADLLRQQAEHDRKLTVEGAQALREKILSDLTRRRRVASTQVEQLRAGRERLLQSYGLVRRTLEEVNDELHRADDEARQAAAEAGAAHEARLGDEAVAPDLLAAVPLPASLVIEEGDKGGAEPLPDSAGAGDAAAGDNSDDEGPVTEDPVTEEPVTEDPAAEELITEEAGTDELGSDEAVSDGAGTDDPESDEWAGDGAGTDDPGSDEWERNEAGTDDPGSDEWAGDEAGTDGADTDGPGSRVTVGSAGGNADAEPSSVSPPPPPPSSLGRSVATGTAVVAPPAREADALDSSESQEAVLAEEPAAVAAAPSGRGRQRRGGAAGVDDLFARLRAGREVAVSQARTVLEGTAGEETPATSSTEGDSDPASAADEAAASAIEVADDPTGETKREPRALRRRTDLDLEPARSDAEEGWLQRRDEALDSVEQALTRRLKRAMQDEQNDLLDRLRSLRGRPTPDSLLSSLEDQQEHFSRAASGLVDQGAQAGVAFALSVLSEQHQQTAPPGTPASVDEVNEQLAAAIVTPLRHRLEETINENGDDDQSVLVEALGAAYREWKTQRLERIAGDALADAFARGVLHATPASVPLQWVVDDVDGPCSDCDDNVLAGALPREEAFPTGQFHPPAHAGCRCIVVPSA